MNARSGLLMIALLGPIGDLSAAALNWAFDPTGRQFYLSAGHRLFALPLGLPAN